MLQFIDEVVNAINAETRVVPARHVVTVMQVFISGACLQTQRYFPG